MRIYVGCGLTHATEESRLAVDELKDKIRGLGHEVSNFVGLNNGTARDVYDHDIGACVAQCDIFIAILGGELSEGLAYELAVAIEVHKKRTLIFRHKDRLTTRLILGIPEEKASQVIYEDWVDLFEQIKGALEYIDDSNKQLQLDLVAG